MARVLFERTKLEELKLSKTDLRGKEGSCYLQNDNKTIIKLFHYWDKYRKIYFDNLESENIAFPIDILIDEYTDMIVGYTMKCLNGSKLLNGFRDNLSLTDLKRSYLKIKQEIEKFPSIYMQDLCLENILFNYPKKGIYLIDTSKWVPKDNSASKNIKLLSDALMACLTMYNLDWTSYPLNQDKELHELYRMNFLGNEALFYEFLSELQKKASSFSGYEVKTIGDLTLKKYKKS